MAEQQAMAKNLTARADVAFEGAASLLEELVRRPTENPPGDVGEAMEWLAGVLEDRSLGVERYPVPEPFARRHKRHDMTNLVVRCRFGPGPVLALHAPIDTLPAGAGWNREPFGAEIRDGRLYGRGARDSKADVACYVAVAEALAASGQASGTLELHLTADEESGGFLGPSFLLSHDIVRPDAVIAAGTSYQVIVGQEGVLHLEVVLRGRQAHASRPADGHDAIAATGPILTALSRLSKVAGAPPLTVSTINGGRGVNLVADRVALTVDRRVRPGEDGEAVEAALIAEIEAAHEDRAVSLECRRILLADPVTPSPPSEQLARTLSRHAAEAFGADVPVVSAPVVSGARHYARAGIALALYGVGPPIVGEAVDFAGDESVALSDLKGAIVAIASAAREVLSAPA